MTRPTLGTFLLTVAVVVTIAVLALLGIRETAQAPGTAVAPPPLIAPQPRVPGHEESTKSASDTSKCAPKDQPTVRITAESIGPIALDSSIRGLRRQFPEARDHKFFIEETPVDGVDFRVGGLVATAAVNHVDSFAESWVVHGVGGTLACGVPMNATWGELRRHYGKPDVHGGELGVYADFPGLKGLSLGLFLGISEHLEEVVYEHPDADSIPDSARVVDRVLIVRRRS